jgi:hypothetical protein
MRSFAVNEYEFKNLVEEEDKKMIKNKTNSYLE